MRTLHGMLIVALLACATAAAEDTPASAPPPAQPSAAATTQSSAAAVPVPAAVPAPAPANDAAAKAPAVLKAPAPFKPPPGYKARTQDGRTVYCRKDVVLGSRFPVTYCMTESQLKDEEERNAAMRSELSRRSPVCPTPGACGGE